MVKLYLLIIVIFLTSPADAQKFRDFDLVKFEGVSEITSANLPNYYIEVLKNREGRTTALKVYRKDSSESKYINWGYEVFELHTGKILFAGNGKARTNYGTLFPKRKYVTDSFFIVNDTLIHKWTWSDKIRIQTYTGLNSDSIFYKEKLFPFATSKGIKSSPLANFIFYKQWFQIPDTQASEISWATICMKCQDIIMKWFGFHYFHYSIYKKDFDHSDLPLSFFWLKQSGQIR